MTEGGLPTRQYKKVVVKESTKKDKDWVTKDNPWFCSARDPDTNKKCGRVLSNWDMMFYNQYGMCEKCWQKYNPHIEELVEQEKELNEGTKD